MRKYRPKEIKKELIPQIVPLYLSDISTTDIAERFNVPRQTIYDWMHEEGIQKPRKKHCLNHPDRPRVKGASYCRECQNKIINGWKVKRKYGYYIKPKPDKYESQKQPYYPPEPTDPKIIALKEKYKNMSKSGNNCHTGQMSWVIDCEYSAKPSVRKHYFIPYD